MEIVRKNPGILYADYLLVHGGVRRDLVFEIDKGNYDLKK